MAKVDEKRQKLLIDIYILLFARLAYFVNSRPSGRIQSFFALTPLETVPFCPILFVVELLTGLTSGLAPDIIELSLKVWLVGLEGKDSSWEM
jgi:hypothetical protein